MKTKTATADSTGSTVTSAESVVVSSDDSDEGEGGARGVDNREYIKELLIKHPVWKDGNYWEQALWQCAIEQVNYIPTVVSQSLLCVFVSTLHHYAVYLPSYTCVIISIVF